MCQVKFAQLFRTFCSETNGVWSVSLFVCCILLHTKFKNCCKTNIKNCQFLFRLKCIVLRMATYQDGGSSIRVKIPKWELCICNIHKRLVFWGNLLTNFLLIPYNYHVIHITHSYYTLIFKWQIYRIFYPLLLFLLCFIWILAF